MANKQGTTTAAGGTPPRIATPILPSPPSETEAKLYYFGLPSRPILVARSSTTPWGEYTGPEEDRPRKGLGPVGYHPIGFIWENGLADKLIAILDSLDVKFTSLDLVRIRTGDDYEAPAPVVLWIGVMPGSLSGEHGVVVVSKCLGLLGEHDITDVEVEIRESVVVRY